MQNFSFIKGLVIGSIFSAMFWIGAYYTITSFTNNDSTSESKIPSIELIEHQARF